MDYVDKLVNKQIYDKSGLVYGFGHAIYSISDPRAEVLTSYCKNLAQQKNQSEKYDFYHNFEKATIDYFQEVKDVTICANVDFYSGFAYELLNIPSELYLPIFSISRTIGWLAHNLENKLYCNKIVRPASFYIGEYLDYTELEKR
jgi:citrate synthase